MRDWPRVDLNLLGWVSSKPTTCTKAWASLHPYQITRPAPTSACKCWAVSDGVQPTSISWCCRVAYPDCIIRFCCTGVLSVRTRKHMRVPGLPQSPIRVGRTRAVGSMCRVWPTLDTIKTLRAPTRAVSVSLQGMRCEWTRMLCRASYANRCPCSVMRG